ALLPSDRILARFLSNWLDCCAGRACSPACWLSFCRCGCAGRVGGSAAGCAATYDVEATSASSVTILSVHFMAAFLPDSEGERRSPRNAHQKGLTSQTMCRRLRAVSYQLSAIN